MRQLLDEHVSGRIRRDLLERNKPKPDRRHLGIREMR
jgi:hypothetical protein